MNKGQGVFAQSRVGLLLIVAVMVLQGCGDKEVETFMGVVPDDDHCNPSSSEEEVRLESQSACHVGVPGDGVQVRITRTRFQVSFESDTATQERLSIFLRNGSDFDNIRLAPIEAFYSSGLVGLHGKTGCVGVLDKGEAETEGSMPRYLRYDLTFHLVSPRGWKEDCQSQYRVVGKVNL